MLSYEESEIPSEKWKSFYNGPMRCNKCNKYNSMWAMHICSSFYYATSDIVRRLGFGICPVVMQHSTKAVGSFLGFACPFSAYMSFLQIL